MLHKYILIFLIAVNFSGVASSQETMFLPDSATIYFGNQSPAAIFGYFRNEGNVSMQENSKLYFLGKIWINELNGKITDASTVNNTAKGGTVHFYQPNPVWGNLGQQVLQLGYVDSLTGGSAFSNLTIDNNAGLVITSDVKVLNTVNFRRGHIYLNNHNFVVGDDINLARITGYDPSRYFVTGSNTSGGFLKFRSVYSGAIASFPVGPTDKNYTPLQIINKGSDDHFYARAFEKVFANATSGSLITDSTLQVTWELGKASANTTDVVATLQHDGRIEDEVFKSNRDRSFISLYGLGKWDKPVFYTKPQSPGNITTSFPIPSALINSRKLVLHNEPIFMTKKVVRSLKTFNIPNAFSPNGDNVNDRWNINGLRDYENCLVEIFNRYGQLIYRSVGYNQPWDGTYKGAPMPVATYYYVIDLKNGEPPIGGYVTLLR